MGLDGVRLLGLGSFLFGRLADRMAPIVLYRRLELGIGLFGLASPFVLAASTVPFTSSVAPGSAVPMPTLPLVSMDIRAAPAVPS